MNPNPPRQKSDLFWNLLTILVLLGALIVIVIAGVIFNNPDSAINPFRPPELPALASLPTDSVESTLTPASAAGVENAATAPFIPSVTPALIIQSPTPANPSPVPTLEAPPNPGVFDFVVLDEPLALPADEYDPARGCEWMGVAGQVFDLQGLPVRGLRVLVRAVLDGQSVEVIGMSGTAQIYGPSGYEIRLADRPISSNGQAAIQLIDQAGLPLSEAFVFDTSDSCEENLLLIDFQEIR